MIKNTYNNNKNMNPSLFKKKDKNQSELSKEEIERINAQDYTKVEMNTLHSSLSSFICGPYLEFNEDFKFNFSHLDKVSGEEEGNDTDNDDKDGDGLGIDKD